MIFAGLVLGIAIVAGILAALAVRDLASERQFMHSLWITTMGMFALTFYIAFTAEAFIGSLYGIKALTLLIATLAGSVGYMIGATLSLTGISLRS